MLDPTRYSLDAQTVGFRKRTLQTVDWGAFNQALQTQTDCIKVRRELEETPVSELHVMGGQRFGLEGNVKTNELARQQRQMNGYVLRSFLSTGGPVILPPKKNDSVLGLPSKFGQVQYTPNAVLGQQYVSSFTEPLNAPLENNTILLGRQGIEARSNSISDPYKALQFQMGMEASQAQIKAVADAHAERKSADAQADFARQSEILSVPKHLRPTASLMQQIKEQQGIARLHPSKRRKGIAFDLDKSKPPPNPLAQELLHQGLEGEHATRYRRSNLYLKKKGKAWEIPSGEPRKFVKQNKSTEPLSPIHQDLETEYRDYGESFSDFESTLVLDLEEYQRMLDMTSKAFDDETLEMTALEIQMLYDIEPQESRQILLEANGNKEEAFRMAQAINADNRFQGAKDPEFSAAEQSRLTELLSDADIDSLYSATNFDSAIGTYLSTKNITPTVPLRNSELVLNDTGVPTSLPSAGFGQTPNQMVSESPSTEIASYMQGKPPVTGNYLQPSGPQNWEEFLNWEQIKGTKNLQGAFSAEKAPAPKKGNTKWIPPIKVKRNPRKPASKDPMAEKMSENWERSHMRVEDK